jgi:HK97 gp10 family phage protein
MDQIKIDIQGLEEVKKAMNNLDAKLSRKLLMQALRKATNPFMKTAKQLAYPASQSYRKGGGKFKGTKMPPGNLRKSIGYKAILRYPPVIYIGPGRGAGKKYDAYYAHWIEYGRDAYKDKIIPRPFMRPAWDINKDAAIEIIRKYLYDELVKMGKWQ